MEARVEQVSPVVKKMMIQLKPDEVREPYEQALHNLKRSANIPGFRKGKAPTRVVESRYKREIEGEVLRFVAHDTYPEAVKQHQEDLGTVIFEEMTRFEFNADRSVETEFYMEILPEFDLQPIEGETLEIPASTHDLERDTEMVLKDIQKQMIRYKPIERTTAEANDFVEVSVKGTDDEDNPVVDNENLSIQLEASGQWELLVPELIGMNLGEEKTCEIHYPEEDRFAALKGRKVTFQVKLNQLNEQVIPEINDELAREMGQFDTLEDLKNDIRKNLTQKYEQADRGHRQRAVMTALTDKHSFDVPPSMIDREARQLTDSYFRQLAQYGIPMETDEERIRAVYESQKEEAERRVRESLILTRFAEEKKVDVSDKEVDEILEKYASGFGEDATVETMRKLFAERGELDNIHSMVRQDKTFDLLIDSVTFKETKTEPEQKETEKKPKEKAEPAGKDAVPEQKADTEE